jgi:hypothetical protein
MRPPFVLRTTIVTTCLVAAGIVPLAQSLADVAREEEVRRKTIKQPAKVYTNKDLVDVPPAVPPAVAPAPAPTDAANTSASKPQPATKEQRPEGASADATGYGSKGKAGDQAYWSGRMKDLETRLDRDRTLADALQSRINALTADFSARDDPAQRRVIGLERQKALDELDRLRASVLNDQKLIADFQDEARRASVPPGWLR